MSLAQSQRGAKTWLVAIGIIQILLHLLLVRRSQYPYLLPASSIFWAATAMQLYTQRHYLSLRNHRATWGGLLLLAGVVYRGLHTFESDYFLRLYPLLVLVSLSLLASGVQGLAQYQGALYLLGFFALPWELLYLLDFTTWTTQFSTALLRLMGFAVHQQGFTIALPGGAIEVYNGCSGVRSITQLLGLAWIYVTLTATQGRQKYLILLGAVGIGFFANGCRVALLAILSSQPDTLHYWHQGDGSLLFSLLAVLLLGLLLLSLPTRQGRYLS